MSGCLSSVVCLNITLGDEKKGSPERGFPQHLGREVYGLEISN
jgi:hypothetical protein